MRSWFFPSRTSAGVLAESLGTLREDELAELYRLLLLAGGAGQAARTHRAVPATP